LLASTCHRPPCAQLRTGADDPVRRGIPVDYERLGVLDRPVKPGDDRCVALQRLVIITRVVVFGRGDVAVLVIIVLYRNAFRLLRFVVGLFRRLVLLTRSAHLMPFSAG